MYTAKDSISSWWVLLFVALMLWYRNGGYDRVLSIFLVILAIVQLIEYAIYSGANTQQSARALYISLWVQCLALIIGVYIFVKYCSSERSIGNPVVSVAAISLIVFVIAFIVLIIIAAIYYNFESDVSNNGVISYYINGEPMLQYLFLPYIIGLIVPLAILLINESHYDVGLMLIIGYILICGIYIAYTYPPQSFTGSWSYLTVGLGFIIWFVGIIKK